MLAWPAASSDSEPRAQTGGDVPVLRPGQRDRDRRGVSFRRGRSGPRRPRTWASVRASGAVSGREQRALREHLLSS